MKDERKELKKKRTAVDYRGKTSNGYLLQERRKFPKEQGTPKGSPRDFGQRTRSQFFHLAVVHGAILEQLNPTRE